MTLTQHRIMSPGAYFFDPGGPIREPFRFSHASQNPFRVFAVKPLLVITVGVMALLLWGGMLASTMQTPPMGVICNCGGR